MTNRFKKMILLIGDIAVLYLSLYLTLWLRYFEEPNIQTWINHLIPFTPAFAAWILLFYVFGLYDLNLAVNNRRFFNKTLQAAGLAGLITALFFYLNADINIAPKTNLVIYLAVFSTLFMLWRHLFNWSLNAYLPKSTIAIIGHSPEAEELIRAFADKPHLGFEVKLLIDNTALADIESNHNNNEIAGFKKMLGEQKIDIIVMAVDPRELPQLREALLQCLSLKINIMDMISFYEQITGKIPVRSIGQMWFLTNLSEGSKRMYDRLKRLSDLVLAFVVLILTAPFWPLIALMIKLESRGPVFFRQTRAGLNSRSFKLVKFRSMREDGNDRSPTRGHDPRVTRFGLFMRRTRLDELPQILNIIVGDMSFIGPRPERPELIEKLEREVPFYRERMLVKPGLTGSDQVSGEYHSPSREDTLKKLQYDLFYIKNRSVYLDFTIILKTIATVFRRSGV